MASPLDDLDLPGAFLSAFGEFEPITIALGGGAAVSMEAIFQNGFAEDLGMVMARLTVDVRTADLGGLLAEGDEVVVGTDRYVARSYESDDHGMTKIMLEVPPPPVASGGAFSSAFSSAFA